jgi:hypothetical protein
MSPELVDALNAGSCPDCKSPVTAFLMGPRGGIAQNICCPACWSAFNAARYRGQFVTAHRIPNGFWRGAPGYTQTGHA